jgi:hypothetical protein
MTQPAQEARRVSLCICPSATIPRHTTPIKSETLPDIETGILTLPFAIACTIAEKETQVWRDAQDLVQYLLKYDLIQTFNGNTFDFVVLAAEIARVAEIQDQPGTIFDSDEFKQVYCALHKKSFDLFTAIRDVSGAQVPLTNVALATYQKTRSFTLQQAIDGLFSNDLLTTVNYVLEGCTMIADLCHVQQSLRKLVITKDDGARQIIEL